MAYKGTSFWGGEREKHGIVSIVSQIYGWGELNTMTWCWEWFKEDGSEKQTNKQKQRKLNHEALSLAMWMTGGFSISGLLGGGPLCTFSYTMVLISQIKLPSSSEPEIQNLFLKWLLKTKQNKEWDTNIIPSYLLRT